MISIKVTCKKDFIFKMEHFYFFVYGVFWIF
jgi:hypothetical protein